MCLDYQWTVKKANDARDERYKPYYGCGLCQTGVPCEHTIPKKS